MTDPQRLGEEIARDIEAAAPFRDIGDALPDLDAAYAAQAAAVAALAPAHGGIGGRKIAWNTQAQLDAMGLKEPGAACVLKDMMRESPARLDAAAYRTFTIEPEIAAVLGADLAPRAGGHDRESVAAAIARLIPAFELLDRREVGDAGPRAVLANNVFNAGLVTGGPGLPPAEVDPSALRSVVTLNGETLLDKEGAAPMDPLEAAAFLANRFNALGQTLKAGEVLLLGAHLPPRAVPGAAKMRFELGALGAVEFEIA